MQVPDYSYLEGFGYISVPAMIIGGEAHGSVIEPGRNVVQVAKFKGPRLLFDPTGDTRPFADDVITSEVKTIPIEMVMFRLPFAVDDSDGFTKDHALKLLQDILKDIQKRMMEEVFEQDRRERSRYRFVPKPSILDRRSWVTNLFNKYWPKRPSKHWELNG